MVTWSSVKPRASAVADKPSNNTASILVRCAKCGHEGSVAYSVLETKFEEKISAKNINQYWSYFYCKSCGEKRPILIGSNGNEILHPEKIVKCSVCSNPIPLPRLEAILGATTCTHCSENKELPEQIDWPKPPKAFATCPKCKRPTEVRMKKKDQSYFLGCSGYPKCMWKKKLNE